MTGETTIGDLIEIPPVRTVIRLVEGREAPEEIAQSFVFTPEVVAHVNVISEAILAGRGRGYFLQGDFGSGKSHFLAMLFTFLAGGAGEEYLRSGHEGIAKLSDDPRRILPVAISLIDYRSTTPLEQILLEAAEMAIGAEGGEVALSPRSMLIARVRRMITEPEAAESFVTISGAPADQIHEWISENPAGAYSSGLELLRKLGIESPHAIIEERKETFERLFVELERAGFDGIVFLVDELSEFLRSKAAGPPLNEDARTLQFLGEIAGEHKVWIVAAVQESIEATGDIAQSTLRKIKDRFPSRFVLSTVHIRSLISERLVRKNSRAREEIYRIYEHYRGQFPTFTSSFEEFYEVYPVHPVTISLLDGLGTLFSRHRGIVDFVCSRIAGDETRHISSILRRPGRELLGPDSIYEHFSERLSEFSSYNIYPRHVIPHLDSVIESHLKSGEDRYLAKRLVRILVLYRIHPTAPTPTAEALAELVSCSLDAPEMNALFVSEALLDPIAHSSRFLTKRIGDGADGGVYEITTDDDPGKVLDARIERVADGLERGDSRLLFEPLSRLSESDSWPGLELSRGSVTREIEWKSSRRRAVISFLHRDETLASVQKRLKNRIQEQTEWDFILFVAIGETTIGGEHLAIWQVPAPKSGDTLDALTEFLALLLTLDELSQSNPSEAPLIPVAEERLNHVKPAAFQAALEVFYSGAFSDPRIHPDSAIRQLRRFDGLVEAAGEIILADRYPRFAEIAPRGSNPTQRIYQLLLESLIIPGSLSLSEARTRSLVRPIEGLALPLGLVELKRQSYIFSPDISGHPLLSDLFHQIRPSGAISVSELLVTLRTGVFGLPKDTALFLLTSLAAGGLVTIRTNGRALSLEFLNLSTLERAHEVTLGELVGERDRSMLIEECRFLRTSGEWETFGLRQQREAWQEVIRFRNVAERLAGETLKNLKKRREYSSFRAFDFNDLEAKLIAVGKIGDEIRISYPAKEGLEKFLTAFRAESLRGGEIEFMLKLDRFLKRNAEKLIFIDHYVRHNAIETIIGFDDELAAALRSIVELLERPEEVVIPDEGAELDRLFAALRELYVTTYARIHDEYYASHNLPKLSKNGERALQTVRRLAGIEALDRPPGLDRFLSVIDSRKAIRCGRQIREELMRGPLCGCGFHPKQRSDESSNADPGAEIDRFLASYLEILSNPAVLEPLTSHAYAIQDLAPEDSRRLEKIVTDLESNSLRPSVLVGEFDDSLAAKVSKALSGAIALRKIHLEDLSKRLAGRRLTAARLISLFSEWVGEVGEETLFAVVAEEKASPTEERLSASWWRVGSSRLLGNNASTGEIERIGSMLEEHYPSTTLLEPLRALTMEQLLRFIVGERLHIASIRVAWANLTERVMNGQRFPKTTGLECAHADATRAKEIEQRLHLVRRIDDGLDSLYPERLRIRLSLESLISDPWCEEPLKAVAEATLERVEALGETWLDELGAVEPIELEEKPFVLLIDGVAPDIWLSILDRLSTPGEGPSLRWSRLSTLPETVSATAELFGLKGDPSDGLAAIGVPYITMSGREALSVSSSLEGIDSNSALVIRLDTLDRNAHRGTLKLAEMAAVLDAILEKNLLELLRFCTRQNRDLIVTTDHGISMARGGLAHGGGGVYERAIFRAVWKRTRER